MQYVCIFIRKNVPSKYKEMTKIPVFHQVIASGFGSGYCPIAPGTAGACLATLIWWGYATILTNAYSTFLCTLIIVFILTTREGSFPQYFSAIPDDHIPKIVKILGKRSFSGSYRRNGWNMDCITGCSQWSSMGIYVSSICLVSVLRYTKTPGNKKNGKASRRLWYHGR